MRPKGLLGPSSRTREREKDEDMTQSNRIKAIANQLDAANERIAELEAEVLVWKRHWKDLDQELLTLRMSLRCSHCKGTGLTTLRMPIHGERDEVFQSRCCYCNGTGRAT